MFYCCTPGQNTQQTTRSVRELHSIQENNRQRTPHGQRKRVAEYSSLLPVCSVSNMLVLGRANMLVLLVVVVRMRTIMISVWSMMRTSMAMGFMAIVATAMGFLSAMVIVIPRFVTSVVVDSCPNHLARCRASRKGDLVLGPGERQIWMIHRRTAEGGSTAVRRWIIHPRTSDAAGGALVRAELCILVMRGCARTSTPDHAKLDILGSCCAAGHTVVQGRSRRLLHLT